MDDALNVFDEPLETCSDRPLTGFFRDGCCNTAPEDIGLHVVCTRVTAEFLEFSKARGNDLSSPRPEFGFPGLKPGDQWCLCAARWHEALQAGAAPRVAKFGLPFHSGFSKTPCCAGTAVASRASETTMGRRGRGRFCRRAQRARPSGLSLVGKAGKPRA